MSRIRKMVDRTFVIYLVVGVSNYIFCTGLMFFLFNAWGVSEHVAPLINYGLGSLISFFGSKYLIFPEAKSGIQQYLRFALEVLICYGVSYYLLAPLVAKLLLQYETVYSLFTFGGGAKVEANCEMAACSILYAILNYFGQRYFVFTDRFEYHREQYEK